MRALEPSPFFAGDWLALRPNSEAAVHSATLAVRRVLAAGTG
ncbi:hypothetical protein [Streptomyces murinus]|nr:hypothetical protein [Streptomyces murinus]